MTGRSPSDKLVKIHLVIGDHATNVGKGCGDFVPPTTPTVTSTVHASGYFTGHFGPPPGTPHQHTVACVFCRSWPANCEFWGTGKWHIGDSAAWNGTDGVAP